MQVGSPGNIKVTLVGDLPDRVRDRDGETLSEIYMVEGAPIDGIAGNWFFHLERLAAASDPILGLNSRDKHYVARLSAFFSLAKDERLSRFGDHEYTMFRGLELLDFSYWRGPIGDDAKAFPSAVVDAIKGWIETWSIEQWAVYVKEKLDDKVHLLFAAAVPHVRVGTHEWGRGANHWHLLKVRRALEANGLISPAESIKELTRAGGADTYVVERPARSPEEVAHRLARIPYESVDQLEVIVDKELKAMEAAKVADSSVTKVGSVRELFTETYVKTGFGGVAAICGLFVVVLLYLPALVWFFFPELLWWQLGVIFLGMAVVSRALHAFFPAATEKVNYALKPIFIVFAIPLMVALVAAILVVVTPAGLAFGLKELFQHYGKRAVAASVIGVITLCGFFYFSSDFHQALQASAIDRAWAE